MSAQSNNQAAKELPNKAQPQASTIPNNTKGCLKLFRPKVYWNAIRREYETGTISLVNLARAHGLPRSTMSQRAMREKWRRHDKLVRAAARDIAQEVDKRVQARLESDLAPWIEAEKVKFTRAGVRLAKSGLKRVSRLMKVSAQALDPKDESFIAKSGETYHRIGRVALGMSDGSAPISPLSLNVLANHSAIQIVTAPGPGPDLDPGDQGDSQG